MNKYGKMITKSEGETVKVAKELANKLIKKKSKTAVIIALKGELGAGKTTFIRGFSKVLGVREKILSPTFVLIHKHKLSYKPNWSDGSHRALYHIDAYRLNSAKELEKLGVKEIFSGPENIVLIEWADRVEKIIPKNAIWVHMDHISKNKRKILIK